MLAKKGKKILAMLLTLCMVLGLLPVSAMATPGYENQIVENGETLPEADGKVTHSKMIAQVGENLFDITLNVTTQEEIQKETISPDAAVVIVMDVSNSMKETPSGGDAKAESDQRIYKAKEAAKNFIDSFAKDAGEARRQVAVVEFGSSANTVTGWTTPDAAKTAVGKVNINYEYPACGITGTHTHDENTIEWGGFLGLMWRCTERNCKDGYNISGMRYGITLIMAIHMKRPIMALTEN